MKTKLLILFLALGAGVGTGCEKDKISIDDQLLARETKEIRANIKEYFSRSNWVGAGWDTYDKVVEGALVDAPNGADYKYSTVYELHWTEKGTKGVSNYIFYISDELRVKRYEKLK